MFLTNVDAFIEAPGIEEVAREIEVYQGEVTLQWSLTKLSILFFLLLSIIRIFNLHVTLFGLLVNFPQAGDVEVVRGELFVTSNDSIKDFRR
jgi:hypothetical protein